MTKQDLENIYVTAFNKELEARKHEGYTVVEKDLEGKIIKSYDDDTGPGKFYLCGFAWLHYSCSTAEGRMTHKMFKDLGFEPSKDYYGGFNIHLDSSRYHGNGMYEIMVEAYGEVANYLSGLGYPVGVNSRLD